MQMGHLNFSSTSGTNLSVSQPSLGSDVSESVREPLVSSSRLASWSVNLLCCVDVDGGTMTLSSCSRLGLIPSSSFAGLRLCAMLHVRVSLPKAASRSVKFVVRESAGHCGSSVCCYSSSYNAGQGIAYHGYQVVAFWYLKIFHIIIIKQLYALSYKLINTTNEILCLQQMSSQDIYTYRYSPMRPPYTMT